MRLGEHQEIFSSHVALLLTFALGLGYGIRLGELQRTLEQQRIYISTGRSKTLNSEHLNKCAIDIHFTKNGKICYPKEVGAYWESLDKLNQWGGNWKSFKDEPHFQRTTK